MAQFPVDSMNAQNCLQLLEGAKGRLQDAGCLGGLVTPKNGLKRAFQCH